MTQDLDKEKIPAKERILSSSLKLFVQQGYFNTNIPDISKLSQCSVGSIYHHFVNKEEIARTLHERGIKLFREALLKGISDASDTKDIVRKLIVSFLNFAEEHESYSRYLWLSRHVEFINDKILPPTTVGYDELGRKLSKTLVLAQKNNEIQSSNAEIIWNSTFGMPLSFIRDWLDGYTRKSPSEVANTIADRCWEAIKGQVN